MGKHKQNIPRKRLFYCEYVKTKWLQQDKLHARTSRSKPIRLKMLTHSVKYGVKGDTSSHCSGFIRGGRFLHNRLMLLTISTQPLFGETIFLINSIALSSECWLSFEKLKRSRSCTFLSSGIGWSLENGGPNRRNYYHIKFSESASIPKHSRQHIPQHSRSTSCIINHNFELHSRSNKQYRNRCRIYKEQDTIQNILDRTYSQGDVILRSTPIQSVGDLFNSGKKLPPYKSKREKLYPWIDQLFCLHENNPNRVQLVYNVNETNSEKTVHDGEAVRLNRSQRQSLMSASAARDTPILSFEKVDKGAENDTRIMRNRHVNFEEWTDSKNKPHTESRKISLEKLINEGKDLLKLKMQLNFKLKSPREFCQGILNESGDFESDPEEETWPSSQEKKLLNGQDGKLPSVQEEKLAVAGADGKDSLSGEVTSEHEYFIDEGKKWAFKPHEFTIDTTGNMIPPAAVYIGPQADVFGQMKRLHCDNLFSGRSTADLVTWTRCNELQKLHADKSTSGTLENPLLMVTKAPRIPKEFKTQQTQTPQSFERPQNQRAASSSKPQIFQKQEMAASAPGTIITDKSSILEQSLSEQFLRRHGGKADSYEELDAHLWADGFYPVGKFHQRRQASKGSDKHMFPVVLDRSTTVKPSVFDVGVQVQTLDLESHVVAHVGIQASLPSIQASAGYKPWVPERNHPQATMDPDQSARNMPYRSQIDGAGAFSINNDDQYARYMPSHQQNDSPYRVNRPDQSTTYEHTSGPTGMNKSDPPARYGPLHPQSNGSNSANQSSAYGPFGPQTDGSFNTNTADQFRGYPPSRPGMNTAGQYPENGQFPLQSDSPLSINNRPDQTTGYQSYHPQKDNPLGINRPPLSTAYGQFGPPQKDTYFSTDTPYQSTGYQPPQPDSPLGINRLPQSAGYGQFSPQTDGSVSTNRPGQSRDYQAYRQQEAGNPPGKKKPGQSADDVRFSLPLDTPSPFPNNRPDQPAGKESFRQDTDGTSSINRPDQYIGHALYDPHGINGPDQSAGSQPPHGQTGAPPARVNWPDLFTANEQIRPQTGKNLPQSAAYEPLSAHTARPNTARAPGSYAAGQVPVNDVLPPQSAAQENELDFWSELNPPKHSTKDSPDNNTQDNSLSKRPSLAYRPEFAGNKPTKNFQQPKSVVQPEQSEEYKPLLPQTDSVFGILIPEPDYDFLSQIDPRRKIENDKAMTRRGILDDTDTGSNSREDSFAKLHSELHQEVSAEQQPRQHKHAPVSNQQQNQNREITNIPGPNKVLKNEPSASDAIFKDNKDVNGRRGTFPDENPSRKPHDDFQQAIPNNTQTSKSRNFQSTGQTDIPKSGGRHHIQHSKNPSKLYHPTIPDAFHLGLNVTHEAHQNSHDKTHTPLTREELQQIYSHDRPNIVLGPTHLQENTVPQPLSHHASPKPSSHSKSRSRNDSSRTSSRAGQQEDSISHNTDDSEIRAETINAFNQSEPGSVDSANDLAVSSFTVFVNEQYRKKQ